VKDDSAYAAAGEEALKEAERLRIGMRKGLMPFGRERLAESWYESAQEELRKEHPDHGKVNWYLNAATNLNPKFSEAIDLKVKMTGMEATATDNARSKSLVQRLILEEKGKELHYPSDIPPATVPSLQDRSVKLNTPGAPMVAGPATKPAAVAAAPTPTTKPAVASPVAPAVPVTSPTSRPAVEVTENEVEWDD
jgi:hypothetical protein